MQLLVALVIRWGPICRAPLCCDVMSCVVLWQVPKGQVKTIGTVDKSSTLNTESWGYYACTGTADQVTKAAQKCGKNQ